MTIHGPSVLAKSLRLAEAEPELELRALQVARRPVVEDGVAGDVRAGLVGPEVRPGAADDGRDLELEVERRAARRHRDLVVGAGDGVGVREVTERRLVPDAGTLASGRRRVLIDAFDVLLEHGEVADRRRLDGGEEPHGRDRHLLARQRGETVALAAQEVGDADLGRQEADASASGVTIAARTAPSC